MAAVQKCSSIMTFRITLHLWELSGGEGFCALSSFFRDMRRRARLSQWCVDALVDRFLREQAGDYSTSCRVRELVKRRVPDLIARISVKILDDEFDEERSHLIKQFCKRLESLIRLNKIDQWCAEAVIDRYIREDSGDYSLAGFDSILVGQSNTLTKINSSPVSMQKSFPGPLAHEVLDQSDPVKFLVPVIQESIQEGMGDSREHAENSASAVVANSHFSGSLDSATNTRRNRNKPGMMIMD